MLTQIAYADGAYMRQPRVLFVMRYFYNFVLAIVWDSTDCCAVHDLIGA